MRVKIYQINTSRDSEVKCFAQYDGKEIDSSIYDLVYAGDVKADNLEDIFKIFNTEKPLDYFGRSMSVSDIVQTDEGFFFCDSFGFKKVDFESDLAKVLYKEKIDVVILEPGKKARIGKVDSSLEGMQKFVGGYIEAVYPFEDEVALVCNEEGKISGMALNRGLYGEDGELYDIVAGPCFICGCSETDFCSLTKDQLETYKSQFEQPEMFMRTENGIKGVKIEEEKKSNKLKIH